MTDFPAMVSPDSPGSSSRDTARLVEEDGREGSSSNFWSLTFYQQLFDIDTVDVRNRYFPCHLAKSQNNSHTPRLMYSMLPVPGKSFLQHHIRPRFSGEEIEEEKNQITRYLFLGQTFMDPSGSVLHLCSGEANCL